MMAVGIFLAFQIWHRNCDVSLLVSFELWISVTGIGSYVISGGDCQEMS